MSPIRSRNRPATDPRPRRRPGAWLAAGIPLLLVVALMAVQAAGGPPAGGPDRVPDFELVRTDGATLDRARALADGPALFFFSMGPGCGGCFTQIPELEAGLADRGITLVPVMVDPADVVAAQAALFRVDTPILIDADRRLSEAMGMLGVYGHDDRPSHSFALADPDGTIRWVRHYAEMFVPADALFDELDRT